MKYNYYFAAILSLLRVFLISLAFVFAKKLDSKISSTMILLFRSSCCFVLLTPVFIQKGFNVAKTSKIGLHFLRGVCGSVAMLFTYYSARQLPLAVSSTISMSLPLFITLLSCFILHETIKPKQWVLLTIGYIGVTISLNPSPANIINASVLTGLLANVFLALSIIITNILSKIDTATTIMFYYNLFLVLISITFAGDSIISITSNSIILLFLIGLISVLTQLFSIKSLLYSTPSFVAPFEYTRLVFAIPLGCLVFGEYPDNYTIIGAIIIICANVMLARIKQ